MHFGFNNILKLMGSGLLFLGIFLLASCGSKSNPTANPPTPTPTPAYSSSAVTIVPNPGSFSPYGLAFDPANGNLWLTNGMTNYLAEYTTAGSGVVSFGTYTGTTAFSSTSGVNVGPDGTVFVADYGAGQIDVFTASGTYLADIPGLTKVVNTAVNSAGTTLYVLEVPSTILTFSITGTTTKTFNSIGVFSTTASGVGALNAPQFMALDSTGNVYVTNTTDIVKYGPTGSNPVSFGSAVLNASMGIAVDSAGNVLASQYATPGFIQEFNPSGSGYTAGVTFGNSCLSAPCGLTLDTSGNLYAANQNDDQILEFKNIY